MKHSNVVKNMEALYESMAQLIKNGRVKSPQGLHLPQQPHPTGGKRKNKYESVAAAKARVNRGGTPHGIGTLGALDYLANHK